MLNFYPLTQLLSDLNAVVFNPIYLLFYLVALICFDNYFDKHNNRSVLGEIAITSFVFSLLQHLIEILLSTGIDFGDITFIIAAFPKFVLIIILIFYTIHVLNEAAKKKKMPPTIASIFVKNLNVLASKIQSYLDKIDGDDDENSKTDDNNEPKNDTPTE